MLSLPQIIASGRGDNSNNSKVIKLAHMFTEGEGTTTFMSDPYQWVGDSVAQFEKENPEYKVELEYISGSDYSTKILSDHASGIQHDVVMCQLTYNAQAIHENALADISDYFSAWSQEDQDDLFLLPITVIMLTFMFWPILECFLRSIQGGAGEFVGLKHFRLFMTETRFRNNIRNTLVYVSVAVALIIPVGLLAAHLITDDSRMVKILRPMYLIPWVIPYVCSSILFRSMFNGQGPISRIIYLISGEQVLFLSNPKYAIVVIIMHQFWRAVPFAMLFMAAGLTTIPTGLYEAASIDGAYIVLQKNN